ncbi:MAG TPA: serine hydrolase, partial [Balneolaceae bacterium]|nr:serine hydrolase [Balneolaceae bacterium]
MEKKFTSLATLLLLLFLVTQRSFCQNSVDQNLQQKLKSLLNSFHGTAGVYVRNLQTGQEAGVNADTIFPTASIVKIPIVIGIFNKIKQGKLSYHQSLIYRDSMAHGGSGLMQFFKDSTKTDLSRVVTLMLARSDNTAALWCQRLAGGGKTINKWLASHGFKYTRVNSRTPGRSQNWQKYGWGQTTPREMANLLVMIRQGKAVSSAASQRIYRDLTRTYWDDYALSQIPPYVQVASKQGMISSSHSEAVLVNAPHGDYVFYFATKNDKDQRWKPDNEAWELDRKVSALLWHYFEP